MRDLHLQLDREEVWRLEDGLAPTLFERTFGDMRDAESWPAVEVALADGSVVRFRGAIDRVDVSPSRVLVIDYKTGGVWGYDGLDADPVLAGHHLQLVLYGQAARANVADPVGGGPRRIPLRLEQEASSSAARSSWTIRRRPRLAEVVRHAASGIRAGAFLPMPGEFDRGTFSNCRFCEFDRICSTSRDQAWQRKSPHASFVPLEALGVTADGHRPAALDDADARQPNPDRSGSDLLCRGRRRYRENDRLGWTHRQPGGRGQSHHGSAGGHHLHRSRGRRTARPRAGSARARRGRSGRAPDEQARCRRAVEEIDLAAISTIHAFAGQLLRTFPLEAGLPPGFATLDEIQQALAFDERFNAWFWRDALQEPLRSVLKRALLLGMTQDTLRKLAAMLEDRHDLLAPDTTWEAVEPPSALTVAAFRRAQAHAAPAQRSVRARRRAGPAHPDRAVRAIERAAAARGAAPKTRRSLRCSASENCAPMP